MCFKHSAFSCQNGTGDLNDLWLVEVCGGRKGELVKVLRSKVRFLYCSTSCVLYSSGRTLPKWGWGQAKVTCGPYVKETPNSQWNIEDHNNSKLPNISLSVLKPTFLEVFYEFHIVMIRGLRFSGINETEYRVYLLGNPIIWWINLFSLGLCVVMVTVASVAVQRGVELEGISRSCCS